MVKEKAKPISLEELDEQIRRKEQSQDSNNANDPVKMNGNSYHNAKLYATLKV